jgi:Protein of unknown function (DUF2934)
MRNCDLMSDVLQGGMMPKQTARKREPTDVEIARRAFELYLARGGDHGHDVADWFEAERQLRERRSRKSPVKGR